MSADEQAAPGEPTEFADDVEEALRLYSIRNRRGHVFVPGDLLGALIGLPEGAKIVSMFSDYRREGIVVSFVSPDLPEIEEAVESTQVIGQAMLRYAPAPAPDTDDVLLEQANPDDVLYARMSIQFPQPLQSQDQDS